MKLHSLGDVLKILDGILQRSDVHINTPANTWRYPSQIRTPSLVSEYIRIISNPVFLYNVPSTKPLADGDISSQSARKNRCCKTAAGIPSLVAPAAAHSRRASNGFKTLMRKKQSDELCVARRFSGSIDGCGPVQLS